MNMATSPSVIEYDGQKFTEICGLEMSDLRMGFFCCKVPDHEDDHAFAANHARYVFDKEASVMYWSPR